MCTFIARKEGEPGYEAILNPSVHEKCCNGVARQASDACLLYIVHVYAVHDTC